MRNDEAPGRPVLDIKITHVRQELRMRVYLSLIDLSRRTLRLLAGQLSVRQVGTGTQWRRLPVGRQALGCGDMR
jgi:hypothetical protein